KAIVTLPALAVSELLSYLSWPSVFAARLSVCPPAAAPLAGGEVAVGVLIVAEVLLLDELPQPASTSRPTAGPRSESLATERLFAALSLTDETSSGCSARAYAGARRGRGTDAFPRSRMSSVAVRAGRGAGSGR